MANEGLIIKNLPIHIEDKPNTFRRIVMLDTGRNFFHTRLPLHQYRWVGAVKKENMSDQEILKQRDLLDAILASRTTSQYERLESMKVMDSIYFKENLPENVVLFPLQRIKRYVHTTTRKPSKKSL